MHIKLLQSIVWSSIAAAPLLSGANAGFKVWVVSDSVRVDPVSSQPFEENRQLFPDGIRGNYKQSNLIWDGTAQHITLKAARNETVAFQIVIERTGDKLSGVTVAPPALKGPNGTEIL